MALTPEYLEKIPDAAVTLWRQAENDILRDVARRLNAAGELTSSAAWQLYRLAETQALRADVVKLLAKYTGRSNAEIRKILQQAGTETMAADDALYHSMGFAPAGINENPALLNLLNAGYRQTLGSWRNLTATTAFTVAREFGQRLDRAWLQLSSGAFDYNTVIKRAVHDLARTMKFVEYPTGHRDTLEVAVRRCVLTGANQTCAKLQLARAEEMGCEFVEVSAHAGARPTHAVWQGKVYHIGGAVVRDGVAYADFKEATRYGTGAGLAGWNCRHNFSAFWPGISVRNYDDAKLTEMSAKTETYQGKQYTKYEISQMRRALERKVRALEKRYVAEDAAGVDAGNTAARLAGARTELRQFIKDTGGKVDGARTDVPEMGYKAARKAEKAARATQAEKSTTLNDWNGGLENKEVTEASFERLKRIESSLLDKQGRSKLVDACTELLGEAKKVPLGNEVGRCYTMSIEPLGDIEHGENGRIKLKTYEVPYYALHTHASGLTFSPDDLDAFVKRSTMRGLIAVGNNGAVFVLEKGSNYNAKTIEILYFDYVKAMLNAQDRTQIVQATLNFFKNGGRYGLYYFS